MKFGGSWTAMNGKNWKTTVAGLAEAVLLEFAAEMFIDNMDWKKRSVILTLAVARAVAGYFAKDRDVSGVA